MLTAAFLEQIHLSLELGFTFIRSRQELVGIAASGHKGITLCQHLGIVQTVVALLQVFGFAAFRQHVVLNQLFELIYDFLFGCIVFTLNSAVFCCSGKIVLLFCSRFSDCSFVFHSLLVDFFKFCFVHNYLCLLRH